MTDQIAAQLKTEIGIINRTFAGLGISAGTRPAWTVVAGGAYVAFGLRLGPAVVPAVVDRALPKLAENLSAARRRPCPVRLRYMPLALEVAHPAPAPLYWRRAVRAVGALRPGQALAGRRWDAAGGVDDVIDLDADPHLLIAGATGSGKSTLEIMVAASLAVATSPADLELYLIDLKNEDLVPLSRLPHVRGVAVDFAGAVAMVEHVQRVKNERVKAGRIGDGAPRVVLVVDELGQLAGDPVTLDRLGDILQVGRSKRINVIAATQKPTAAIVGSQSKANYTIRLVGRVVDANESATATGRRAAGAEYLPGAGAFLRVGAGDPYRLQAFDLAGAGVEYLAAWAREKWPAADSDGLPVWSSTAPAASVNVYSAASAAAGQDSSSSSSSGGVLPADSAPVPADLADVFDRYYDGAGGLARGGKSAAIRVLVGDVPGGRAFQAAAGQVDQFFGAWLLGREAVEHGAGQDTGAPLAPIVRMAAARG